jgi:hypothetical protein
MKGRHEYKVPGQRKSGDDNTSCDNTILNIAAHAWVIARYHNLALAELPKRCKIMALGDDIVVQGDPEVVRSPFGERLALIGWTPKPRVAFELCDVDFCSRIPWPSTNGIKFAARPGRALARFPFSAVHPCPVDVGTKAYGLYLDNAHVPFLRRYLERCLELHPVKAQLKTQEWQFRPSSDTPIAHPVDGTWVMLYELYGLTRADEDAYASRLQAWDGRPCFSDDHVVNYLFSVENIGGTVSVL